MEHFELSSLGRKYLKATTSEIQKEQGKMVSVDPVVSEVAGFYEKIRSAMEYQEEEVVLRSSIERILRRRLLFANGGDKVAEPMIRELAWAKYFPDNTFPEFLIAKISGKIDLYLKLKKAIKRPRRLGQDTTFDWLLQVMSADIAFTINPKDDMQIISNFMFHALAKKIKIEDDPENKEPLIFLNIKRALAKEDKAFLRYELFTLYFGELSESNLEEISKTFWGGYKKIESIFSHPLNESIFTYVKKQAIPFSILRDVVNLHKPDVENLFSDQQKLGIAIALVCKKHYLEIAGKTRRAIVRSIIFLFVTKALFALFVEGVVERLIYGRILWFPLSLNTLMPPAIMVLLLFFIKMPGRENSQKITELIRSLLFDEDVPLIEEKSFLVHTQRNNVLYAIFIGLWLFAFFFGLFAINFVLGMLRIDIISQGVFTFFLIVVSFLAYRINQSAKIYNVADQKDNFTSVFFNFFFMPFIHLGRRLTLSFSKLNVFLIIFDFIIETPFKTIFSFMEKWFLFLRGEREKLG